MNQSKPEHLISWLHVSDLHLFESSFTHLLRESIRDLFHNKVDFLVVTGDLHQYEPAPAFGIGNYTQTLSELDALMEAVGLSSKDDLFMVPGNHDAVTSAKKQACIPMLDEACLTNPDGYFSYLETLEPAFTTYKYFLRTFYGDTQDRTSQAIHNHTCLWRNSVEILHLNTALTCDGNNARSPLVNLRELAGITRKKPDAPLLVLAHHSFFDIHKIQQPTLKAYLDKLGAAAYLCGDYHREYLETISLDSKSIPMFVCGKSTVDPADAWSQADVVYYQLHSEKPGWPVDVRLYHWNEQGPRLEPSFTYVDQTTLLKCVEQDQMPFYRFWIRPEDRPSEPLSSDISDSLDALSEKAERSIWNSLLFPWLPQDSLSFSYLYETLYVEPKVLDQNSDQTMSLSAFLSSSKNTHCQKLWVLGNAGIGKSTLLKTQFLECRKAGIPCLCLSVNSLFQTLVPDEAAPLSALLNGEAAIPSDFRLFLDGIDEAFASRPKDLPPFLTQIDALPCTVWLGCRSDFFRDVVKKPLFQRVTLQEWDNEEISQYVFSYFRENTEAPAYLAYQTLCQANPYLKILGKTPFHLSLLLFLIKNRETTLSVSSLYDLYAEFFQQWLAKERFRNADSNMAHDDIYGQLEAIARKLYTEGTALVSTSDPSVLSLLSLDPLVSDRRSVRGFCHQSFVEFLLARSVIEALKFGPPQVIQVLRTSYRSDVSSFIKDAFSTARPTEKRQFIETLISAYKTAGAPDAFLTEDERFYVKNQIIYYMTRIPGAASTTACNFLRDIYPRETQTLMRQDIAYGAANLGLFDIALEFAQSMTPGSDEDRANRAWTLVFYGDRPGEDPLRYTDDLGDWTRSRDARRRRLQAADSKSRAFRMFDLQILRGFFESRQWQNLSREELDTIKACETELPGYPPEAVQFLAQAKAKLVQSYEKQLALQNRAAPTKGPVFSLLRKLLHCHRE